MQVITPATATRIGHVNSRQSQRWQQIWRGADSSCLLDNNKCATDAERWPASSVAIFRDHIIRPAR